MAKIDDREVLARLERVCAALERLAPVPPPPANFDTAGAFVWRAETHSFHPVQDVSRLPLALLRGIDFIGEQLLANTERFAEGLPANNALLWGARGMGKSSLVKAIHGAVQADGPDGGLLKLVEIHREDIDTLPNCLEQMRGTVYRFIVFCDDLSFDHDDTSYKSLKAVLEGGIEGRPDNVIFYATSNRRHLMPRDMVENERSSAIRPSEAVEEKVSLSDRFGLWLGFHQGTQDQYLEIVRTYVQHFGLTIEEDVLKRDAIAWAQARGARSGRVAWQFIQDLAGRLGVPLQDPDSTA